MAKKANLNASNLGVVHSKLAGMDKVYKWPIVLQAD